MFAEEDLLPISALQHLLFCERRAALVYIEHQWADNSFTAEGEHLHEKAHEPKTEVRGALRIARGLRLCSRQLGLVGQADVVEFQQLATRSPESGLLGTRGGSVGITLPDVDGWWQAFPVEYKRGRLRREEGYEVQLCAQALCLEEMLGVDVPCGALYYGRTRRRLQVEFDAGLRADAQISAARLHELIRAGSTPRAATRPKCERCSLADLCMPRIMSPRRSARRYLQDAIAQSDAEETS